jgi:CHAT domain-containing protein/Tfp pilus assembly protein PilF
MKMTGIQPSSPLNRMNGAVWGDRSVSGIGLWLIASVCFASVLLGRPVLVGEARAATNEGSATSSGAELLKEGAALYLQGRLEQAATKLQASADAYRAMEQPLEQSDALLALARVYLGLGYTSKAAQTLDLAIALVQPTGDRNRLSAALAASGTMYIETGQLDAAQQQLEAALDLAKTSENRFLQATILVEIGNLRMAQEQYKEALAAFTDSAELVKDERAAPVAAVALVNAGKAARALGQDQQAGELLARALPLMRALPDSRDKVFGLIAIGRGLAEQRKRVPDPKNTELLRAAEVLEEAGSIGERLGDVRAASYAMGYRGQVYEEERRYDEALLLTRRALTLSLQVEAPESLYLWQWQTGRLLKAKGQLEEAIRSIRRAAETLQSIRPELATSSRVRGASLREAGGQVFFLLADLLLQQASSIHDVGESQRYLYEARDAVELFKAAELRDYFRDDCVDVLQSRITKMERVSDDAAVLYPILLPDRTELLVSLPTGIHRFTLPVSTDEFREAVHTFRSFLETRTTREYLPYGQQLYDWMIRPLEEILAQHHITTLVFVPDGPLRTIPLAALHDGKQFLIAKYAVATTPGVNLIDPKPLRRDRMQVLSAGLTDGVQGFAPLPNIVKELAAIEELFGSHPLLNQNFVSKNLDRAMKDKQFSIVHIATHGKFERYPEDSFLLTFDDKLNMNQLNQLIGLYRFRDEPLELLTLSACETAAGDDRAALGLAGLAIKAGARSALATLWFINDEASSVLVAEFYRQLLDPTISKAVALQRAQMKLIQDPAYRHPTYWAPFLLLNNWL